ncbi:precorrin-3B synthase [filamentous cyanobacterium LEGE 11480]|uniref:Precorrin-3B synthase n=1 Tax=Romeriopsis navalis LEGE 11480 TaxID=2777977 RepID=A0A928Z4D7_9CYAN|nr:precorrin-3B synthase [Romeriopsis navalis]MBE9030213.1 precorrin-3B synthase [Romeriopsis navalis LEGE 11480]
MVVSISSIAASSRAGVSSATFSSTPSRADGDACPGLFYQTAAQDGFLTRIRLPGGVLNCAQATLIADVAAQFGQGQVWLTNRANVQLRLPEPEIAPAIVAQLQDLGLAARLPEVDHLRNVMASPTAGIDVAAVMDTSGLVQAIDQYFSSHPELAPLSAKFSVGLDGGEGVSIGDRRNDVWFVATSASQMRLLFGQRDTWLMCSPGNVIELVAAISQMYLEFAPQIPVSVNEHRRSRKPRWGDVVDYLGCDRVCKQLNGRGAFPAPTTTHETNVNEPSETRSGNVKKMAFPAPMTTHETNVDEPSERRSVGAIKLKGAGYAPLRWEQHFDHIGVHDQSQCGLAYVGMIVPLGRLLSNQLHQLSQLAQTYGNGELRLTPWQNLIIPNIPKTRLTEFQQTLESLGFAYDQTHPAGGIVACRGLPGCGASFTETQIDAAKITQHLADSVKLDQPINIHVSGCGKGCAQPSGSDIALMGTEHGYDIYLRDSNQTFGRLLVTSIVPTQLPEVIARIVRRYQRSREPDESFSQFTQRYEIKQLQEIFGLGVS